MMWLLQMQLAGWGSSSSAVGFAPYCTVLLAVKLQPATFRTPEVQACVIASETNRLHDRARPAMLPFLPACRYTPLQVAAGVGVAATVLAGGVAAAKSPAVSEAVSEQADAVWERLESVVPPLQVWGLSWDFWVLGSCVHWFCNLQPSPDIDEPFGLAINSSPM